uniref:DNA repair protein XPC n=1 Tax=Crypthecodinium cohnii TaxID=2866 RepID=A0A516AGQ9_CRYCO|nr:DNA repair protein XPC [Crypthecodinium cohnii]
MAEELTRAKPERKRQQSREPPVVATHVPSSSSSKVSWDQTLAFTQRTSSERLSMKLLRAANMVRWVAPQIRASDLTPSWSDSYSTRPAPDHRPDVAFQKAQDALGTALRFGCTVMKMGSSRLRTGQTLPSTSSWRTTGIVAKSAPRKRSSTSSSCTSVSSSSSSSSSSSPPPLSAVYPLSYCSCPSRRLQLLHAMGKSGDAAPSHEDLVLARLAQLRAAGRLARLVVSFPLPSPTTCLVLLDRRQQLPHPEAWLEVFDPTGRRWTAEGLPERAPGRSKSMLWILACSGSGSIRDVTRRYSDRWSSVLAARGSLQRVWASVTDRHAEPSKGTADEHDEEEGLEDLSSMQQSLAAARADLLDEEDLLRRAKREPIPTSKAAFKRHATYILDSQLRPQDMLWPATAKPVGLFRGQEKVWLRANVLELRTSTQWRRLGRVVKHGEEPTKVLNSSSAFASKLYSEAQTEALPEVADARTLGASFDGDIPVFPGANAFGNFELLDAVAIDRLPRDLAYVPENFARPIASKMGLSFAPAVVGFTREGSNPKPKYGGIVLWRDDLEALEVELAKERKRVEDLAREKRNEQLKSAWKALVKHVLVDLYVEDRYSKASSSHRPQRSRAADGHELLADVL